METITSKIDLNKVLVQHGNEPIRHLTDSEIHSLSNSLGKKEINNKRDLGHGFCECGSAMEYDLGLQGLICINGAYCESDYKRRLKLKK